MSLDQILIKKIKDEGPISIADFMTLALSHPEHGYYIKQDPIGKDGDFTTAPEISQMFGEMIGAWIADTWMQMGRPEKFTLLECGPGRGTLMNDILRATKNIEGFHKAAIVTLMEISPTLKRKQAENLPPLIPHWIESLDDIPRDKPLILIANEFLDALPIHQYEITDNGWAERMVAYTPAKSFHIIQDFCEAPTLPDAICPITATPSPQGMDITGIGEVFETSPAQTEFMNQLSILLKHLGGASLFIDYGYESGHGDTLQALYKHDYCDPLTHIGDADITAHVNFGALQNIIPSALTTQGQFLLQLGIEHRAEILKQNAGTKQTEDIQNALHRLLHNDEMGALFKVIGVTHDQTLNLAGF